MWDGVRTVLVSLCILYYATALLGADKEKDVSVPEIEATLRGSIHAVRGAEWPRSRITGEPQSIAGEADLSNFTLHLPGGRSFTTLTTTVFMVQDDGRINIVSLTPQPQLFDFRWEKLLEFHQAVAEAKRIAKEFKIYDRPSIGKVLEWWERENPQDESAEYSTHIGLGDRFELWLVVKYDIIGDGWYLNLRFYDLDVYGPLNEAPVEAPKP